MAGWTDVITSERIEQFSEILSKILRNRIVKFVNTNNLLLLHDKETAILLVICLDCGSNRTIFFVYCVKDLFSRLFYGLVYSTFHLNQRYSIKLNDIRSIRTLLQFYDWNMFKNMKLKLESCFQMLFFVSGY